MPRLARVALLTAGATILVLLIRQVGMSAIVALLGRVRFAFLGVSAVYALHLVVRATALWRSVAAAPIRYRSVLGILFSGEAVEMLTLAGPLLGEPTKALLLARRGIGRIEAFGATAIEYLLYNVVAFGLLAVAALALLARGSLGDGFHRVVFGLLAVVAVFTAAFVYAAVSRTGLVAPGVAYLGQALGLGRRARGAASQIKPVEEVLVSFIHDRPARLFQVLGIEAAGHALLATEIWIVLTAIGFRVAPIDAIVMEGGIKIVGAAFFFVPGQLGASESVYAVLATAIGVGPAAGLTVALVRRARALLVAAVGLSVLGAPSVRDAGSKIRDQDEA